MEHRTNIVKLPSRNGFAQRTWETINQTPFLPPYEQLNFHRSPVTLDLIREDIFRNCAKRYVKLDDDMKHAINKTRYDFRLPIKCKMLHLNDVFKRESPTWSNSPGLPWKEMGYKTKGDIRNDTDAIQEVRRFWHFVKQNRSLSPADCCAYVRSHIATLDRKKVRSIWGYPATITFGEAVFAVPLINGYKIQGHQEKGHMSYGYELMKGGATKIRKRFASNGTCRYICMDFKNFDKTVPGNIIDIAFDILADNIDFINYEEHGVADKRKMLKMWNYIIRYFKQTPIRMSNGERFRKIAGIASGSYFTQLIGSVVNGILVNYMCLRLLKSYPMDYLVIGDDSLIMVEQKIDFKEVSNLMNIIGMIVNVDKSFETGNLFDVKYLGYKLNSGIPSKPSDDWFAALLLPERPDRSWDDMASRALGLLYAAMGENIVFHKLCWNIVTVKRFEINLSPGMKRLFEYVLGDVIPQKGIYNGIPPTWDALALKVYLAN